MKNHPSQPSLRPYPLYGGFTSADGAARAAARAPHGLARSLSAEAMPEDGYASGGNFTEPATEHNCRVVETASRSFVNS